jgi:hypothetical protein
MYLNIFVNLSKLLTSVTEIYFYINKLRGTQSASELYRRIDRHLAKFGANFADGGVSRGQRGSSPTVVKLSFLDRSGYFSFT